MVNRSVRASHALEIRGDLERAYQGVFTPAAMAALAALLPLNEPRRAVMAARIERRAARARDRRRIAFLDPDGMIPGTEIRVQDAREGKFIGSEIPADLRRQWIQGTGPATRPNAPLEQSIRNVAYALLSGADGWMFDGEDALGQVVDDVARQPAQPQARDRPRSGVPRGGRARRRRDERSGPRASSAARSSRTGAAARSSRRRSSARAACISTTGTSACRDGTGLLGLDRRRRALRREQPPAAARSRPRRSSSTCRRSRPPKKRRSGTDILTALEQHLRLPVGTIKVYVLVEQLEAAFQLMEIRAALGPHFVGFNTGRWDYINSVADAMAWDPAVHQSEHRRHHDDLWLHAELRGPRAARRQHARSRAAGSRCGRAAWSPTSRWARNAGVADGMKRAVAGAEREQREGASGKWVAHWKMVHIVRPVWEKAGADNQLGRPVPRAHLHRADADGLVLLEPAPRTIRGARDLLSVALQYGNAFGQGFQAAALKPADFFGNDDVLYLMEDMATGEIRLSILWEWLHKAATLTRSRRRQPASAEGDVFSAELFERLLEEEYESSSRRSTATSTTIRSRRRCRSRARSCRPTCEADFKAPWYVDLLNINLDNARSRRRPGSGSSNTWTRSARTARGSPRTWISRGRESGPAHYDSRPFPRGRPDLQVRRSRRSQP